VFVGWAINSAMIILVGHRFFRGGVKSELGRHSSF
jgi:hypothetical protein